MSREDAPELGQMEAATLQPGGKSNDESKARKTSGIKVLATRLKALVDETVHGVGALHLLNIHDAALHGSE
jgi:hypothetical protein